MMVNLFLDIGENIQRRRRFELTRAMLPSVYGAQPEEVDESPQPQSRRFHHAFYVFSSTLSLLLCVLFGSVSFAQSQATESGLIQWDEERTERLTDPYLERPFTQLLDLAQRAERAPRSADAYLFYALGLEYLDRGSVIESVKWLRAAAETPLAKSTRSPQYDAATGQTRWIITRQTLSGLPEAQFLLWELFDAGWRAIDHSEAVARLTSAAQAGYDPATSVMSQLVYDRRR